MNCENISDSLVEYCKGELDTEMSDIIEKHIAKCQICKDEYEKISSTLSSVKKSLKWKTLPGKLDIDLSGIEQISPNAEAEKASRKSSRRLRRVPDEGRFFGKLYQKPYIAISIALHVAAVMVLVAIGIKMDIIHITDKENIVPELNTQKVLGGVRNRARQVKAEISNQGEINISKIRQADKAYFIGDYDDGCVWTYLIGRRGNFTEDEFKYRVGRNAIKSFNRSGVNNGNVKIPVKLYNDFFKGNTNVVMVDLLAVPKFERIEIWPENKLDSYLEKHGYSVEMSFYNGMKYFKVIPV
jgi:hypothetical protein